MSNSTPPPLLRRHSSSRPFSFRPPSPSALASNPTTMLASEGPCAVILGDPAAHAAAGAGFGPMPRQLAVEWEDIQAQCADLDKANIQISNIDLSVLEESDPAAAAPSSSSPSSSDSSSNRGRVVYGFSLEPMGGEADAKAGCCESSLRLPSGHLRTSHGQAWCHGSAAGMASALGQGSFLHAHMASWQHQQQEIVAGAAGGAVGCSGQEHLPSSAVHMESLRAYLAAMDQQRHLQTQQQLLVGGHVPAGDRHAHGLASHGTGIGQGMVAAADDDIMQMHKARLDELNVQLVVLQTNANQQHHHCQQNPQSQASITPRSSLDLSISPPGPATEQLADADGRESSSQGHSSGSDDNLAGDWSAITAAATSAASAAAAAVAAAPTGRHLRGQSLSGNETSMRELDKSASMPNRPKVHGSGHPPLLSGPLPLTPSLSPLSALAVGTGDHASDGLRGRGLLDSRSGVQLAPSPLLNPQAGQNLSVSPLLATQTYHCPTPSFASPEEVLLAMENLGIAERVGPPTVSASAAALPAPMLHSGMGMPGAVLRGGNLLEGAGPRAMSCRAPSLPALGSSASCWSLAHSVDEEEEDSVRGGSLYGGSVHGVSVYGASVHGGSVYGGSVHGGSVYGGSYHGGSLYGDSCHGGSAYGGSHHGNHAYAAMTAVAGGCPPPALQRLHDNSTTSAVVAAAAAAAGAPAGHALRRASAPLEVGHIYLSKRNQQVDVEEQQASWGPPRPPRSCNEDVCGVSSPVSIGPVSSSVSGVKGAMRKLKQKLQQRQWMAGARSAPAVEANGSSVLDLKA